MRRVPLHWKAKNVNSSGKKGSTKWGSLIHRCLWYGSI